MAAIPGPSSAQTATLDDVGGPAEVVPTPYDLPDEKEVVLDVDQYIVADDYSLKKRFTPNQVQVMQLRADEYRDAARKQKSHITRACADMFIKNIIESGESLTNADRAKVLQNVQIWFSQRCRKRERVLPNFVHPWSARQTFYRSNERAVKEKQHELYMKATGQSIDPSDDEQGDLDDIDADDLSSRRLNSKGKPIKPFDFFQLAITEEFEALGDDERAKYEEMATQWRKQGPTEDVKQERAEKDAGACMFEFAEYMWKNYGVKLYFFMAFKNTKGQNITSQVDFGQKLYGRNRSFREIVRPTIAKSGVWNRWQQYTREAPADSNIGTNDKSDKDGPLLALKLNDRGEPIIPSPAKEDAPKDIAHHKYIEKILRCVVAHCHALAMGKPIQNFKPNTDNRPPWRHMSGQLLKLMNAESIPDGETDIRDPSAMGLARNKAWVQHWYHRQAAGLVALEFHSYIDSKGIYPRVPWKNLIKDSPAELPKRQLRERRGGDSRDCYDDGAMSDGDAVASKQDEMPQVKRTPKARSASSKGKRKATVEGPLPLKSPLTVSNDPALNEEVFIHENDLMSQTREHSEVMVGSTTSEKGGKRRHSTKEGDEPAASLVRFDTTSLPLNKDGASGSTQPPADASSHQEASSSSVVMTPDGRARRTSRRPIITSPIDSDDGELVAFDNGSAHSPAGTGPLLSLSNNLQYQHIAPTPPRTPDPNGQGVTIQDDQDAAFAAAVSQLVKVHTPSRALVEGLLKIQIEASPSNTIITPSGETAIGASGENKAEAGGVEIAEQVENQLEVSQPSGTLGARAKRDLVPTEHTDSTEPLLDPDHKTKPQARNRTANTVATPTRVGTRERKTVERHWPEDPRKSKGKVRAKGSRK